jgi:hypothetical protein
VPTAHPRPPLARTSDEAHVYLDLHPCVCGEREFPRSTAIVQLDDAGALGSRYDGLCPACGRYREYVFRLPADLLLPPPGEVRYGDGTPSELLDPGEWLWVADRHAGSVPADASGLDPAARRQVRAAISAAAAAMDEVLAFLPDGADAVPAEAMRTDLGRLVYDDEPYRFDRDRLEVVRDTYRDLLAAVS